jgi:Rad3-related DNA helicase
MTYTVAVRALCEFTAKQGDLDLRFTPSATALEGMAGHALAASRRGERYEREVALAGEHEGLRVRGRADGFDPDAGRLDEVKTYRGDLDRLPANRRALHWAQARVYGALMCRARGLARLRVALVYLDVATGDETVRVEEQDAAALEAFFVEQCGRFLDWARQEAAHRVARDEALARLPFPHARFRAGQRALAEGVYRAAVAGRALLAQAPTGIGKTVGTLYPQLKAMPAQRLDKIVCLAAKTPGRGLALEGLRTLRGGAPLRVVELVARDKACEHPDLQCHGASCPLARGFYDRLPAARRSAVDAAGDGLLDRERVRAVALAHEVCPYYLSHELVRWADVVVGDYNYWFDASAMLHGLALVQDWRVALLVDEAHNLVGRAREMYSARLERPALDEARAVAPPPIAPSLRRLARAWNAILDGLEAPTPAYTAFEDVPEGLLTALQNVAGAIADFQANEDAAESPALPPALLQFFFDTLHFTRLAESFGTHSLFDVTLAENDSRDERASTLCLRNLVPAPFLKARFAAAYTATLFSATLSPWHYHADLLGLPEDVAWLDVASPFEAAQLAVNVQPVSTRYADRDGSVEPIVALIARQFEDAPGNYLAFFSSFEYLQQVLVQLRARHPHVPAWEQSRGMAEADRTRFLARFREGGRGIGFAVLGGAFAEGIDLPGDRLVGAFIATLGLPQVNPVNERIKARLDELFGAGHEYTYLYPGLQKVVQAAGRVIRTPTDRGVVHLIDDRYRRPEVRRLLPAWWDV